MHAIRRIPPTALVLMAILLAAAGCLVLLAGHDASAVPSLAPTRPTDEPVYAVLGTEHADATNPSIGTPLQQWVVALGLAAVLVAGHLVRRVARR